MSQKKTKPTTRGAVYRRNKCHHEEGHGGSSVDGPVLDVGLVGQIVRGLDGNFHPLDGQERSQVRRVRRDDDEGERPPEGTEEQQTSFHLSACVAAFIKSSLQARQHHQPQHEQDAATGEGMGRKG